MPQQAACIGPGTQLGPYRIVAPLGAGGMGQVFVALDTKLDRKVAVKVIPPGMVGDPSLALRFEREAKALAALNHPNILSIHDFGMEGDTYYSVTELLEGETLRSRLASGPLDTASALRVAREIAEGLSAAHAKGVVHRDLKPANVFLTEGGRVKILDFGLARHEPATLGIDEPLSEATTRDRSTRPGTILGTVGYMSPEQARGQPTDARTDIFALGVILYEMLTGARPFAGNSDVDVLAAILREPPTPFSRKGLQVSAEVERLTLRCLEKDPASRFQSAGEVAVALEGASSYSSRPGTFFPRLRRSLWPSLGLMATAGGILLLAAAALWLWGRASGSRLPVFLPGQITFAPDLESSPAVSPDGSAIAYVAQEDIWVTDRRGGPPLRLTTNGLSNDHPTWSPDGSALLYDSKKGGRTDVFRVSRFGGAPSLVVPDAAEPAVSPDGKTVAFSRSRGGEDPRIWLAPLEDPTNARQLTGQNDGVWAHGHPSWSPDGRTLCYNDQNDLWIIPAQGGRASRLTADDIPDCNPVWSQDGRHIYFQSLRESGWAIWRIPSGGGPMQRVTLGTDLEQSPSLSGDGKRLAYATAGRWTCSLVNRATHDRVIAATGSFTGESSLSPDGAWLAYTWDRGGPINVWRVPLKEGRPSGEPERMTDQRGNCSNTAWSPDGRWIAYQRLFRGQRHIWVVPTQGGVPSPFTDGATGEFSPEWSPDGRQLAFISDLGGQEAIYAAPFEDGRRTGPPRPIAGGVPNIGVFGWSPDGSRVAFMADDGTGKDVWCEEVGSAASPSRLTRGAGTLWITTDPSSGDLLVLGTWGAAGRVVRRVPFSGGAPGAVPELSALAWDSDLWEVEASRDGRLLAVITSKREGDVWILEAKEGSF